MSNFSSIVDYSNTRVGKLLKSARQCRLLLLISVHLIILSMFLTVHTMFLEFWYVTLLLITGILLALGNLLVLRWTGRIKLCAHVLVLLLFGIITLTNCWLGGIATSYFVWYTVIPIIAAVIINVRGLMVYALMTTVFILLFFTTDISPLYLIAPGDQFLINLINYIAVILLIVALLYSILRENERYAYLLKEQNALLQADQKKFHYLARHDTLTGLPNRSHFNSYLQTILESLDKKTQAVTLFFMDLDGFKIINDTHGHSIGDSLLLQAAKRLQHVLREEDFVARIGGDEFIAVIIHANSDDIHHNLAERIRQEFEQPFKINKLKLHCAISLGIATFPQDSTTADQLLIVADKAMYEEKMRKKNAGRSNSPAT